MNRAKFFYTRIVLSGIWRIDGGNDLAGIGAVNNDAGGFLCAIRGTVSARLRPDTSRPVFGDTECDSALHSPPERVDDFCQIACSVDGGHFGLTTDGKAPARVSVFSDVIDENDGCASVACDDARDIAVPSGDIVIVFTGGTFLCERVCDPVDNDERVEVCEEGAERVLFPWTIGGLFWPDVGQTPTDVLMSAPHEGEAFDDLPCVAFIVDVGDFVPLLELAGAFGLDEEAFA